MKAIVDAFGMYAIETCLLAKLPNLFEPMEVGMLNEDVISRIAAESDQSIAERQELTKRLKAFQQTITTMERLQTTSMSRLCSVASQASTQSFAVAGTKRQASSQDPADHPLTPTAADEVLSQGYQATRRSKRRYISESDE